jgi:hypothetical protein
MKSMRDLIGLTNSEQGKTMQSYECCKKSSGSVQGEGLAELLTSQERPCYVAPITIEVP